tara:strand:- start:12744 stop:13403 length:660 start_codon:yes stop_codon:yes gene_type:complete
MNIVLDRTKKIQEDILKNAPASLQKTNIIAVSKTFDINFIKPLIETGHIHFGENKVQEAEKKWKYVKEKNKNIKLHMVGKLQTNKVKKAIKLFDYIHSLDSKKLAETLKKCENENNKSLSYFIQVNFGNEDQKSGVEVNQLESFFKYCKNEINLNVIGLMCLPPLNSNVEKYFYKMRELNSNLGLKELSMGMSSDYLSAIKFGSTFVRIGSAIFGERNN